MAVKTRAQITAQLSEKVNQYKELDTMLLELRNKYSECSNAELGSDMHGDQVITADYTPVMEQKKKIWEKYGQELYDQMESFFAGPEASNDSSIADWLCKNYVAVRLFTSSDFLEDNPVKGVFRAGNSMHSAVEMAKMFLLKYLPDPEAICWGNDDHVPEAEGKYPLIMFDNFDNLQKERKKYSENFSLGWVKKNIESLVEIKNKSVEPEPEQEVPAAGNPGKAEASGPDAVEEEGLGSFAKKLKDAMTGVNSGEYKTIISSIENWNAMPKEHRGDTPEKDRAAQLVFVKSAIDAYINHKGKDGVKRNVYKKLAAVEELNHYVSEKLKDVTEEELPNAEAKKRFKTIKEKNTLNEDIQVTYKDKDAIKANVDSAALFGTDCSVDTSYNALKCMDRIKKHAPVDKRADLTNMQREWFHCPGKEVSPVYELAYNAVLNGMQKNRLKESDRKDLDELLSVKDGEGLQKVDAAALQFAKSHKLDINMTVTKNKAGREKPYPWDEAKKWIDYAAAKTRGNNTLIHAKDDLRYWRDVLQSDLTSVTETVEKHLLGRASINQQLVSGEYNDRQLIEKWPEISREAGPYKDLFNEGDYESVDKVIENYNKLEARMVALAKPHAQKIESDSLPKAQTAEKQKTKANSLV